MKVILRFSKNLIYDFLMFAEIIVFYIIITIVSLKNSQRKKTKTIIFSNLGIGDAVMATNTHNKLPNTLLACRAEIQELHLRTNCTYCTFDKKKLSQNIFYRLRFFIHVSSIGKEIIFFDIYPERISAMYYLVFNFIMDTKSYFHNLENSPGLLQRWLFYRYDFHGEIDNIYEFYRRKYECDRQISNFNPSTVSRVVVSTYGSDPSKIVSLDTLLSFVSENLKATKNVYVIGDNKTEDIKVAIKGVIVNDQRGILDLTSVSKCIANAELLLSGDSFPVHVGLNINVPTVHFVGQGHAMMFAANSVTGTWSSIVKSDWRCDASPCGWNCKYETEQGKFKCVEMI